MYPKFSNLIKRIPDVYRITGNLFFISVQGQLNCDFTSGPCLWTQDKTDQFDWTRKSGATATVNTGPPSDHTQQTSGRYQISKPHTADTR